MSREEIHKLIGGYATGTLTAEEQEALFQAALEDQELFDALAQEQALRDLLSDPASKAQLLTALQEKPARWHERMRWLWARPLGTAAAALAVAGMAAVGWIWWRQGGAFTASAPRPPLVAEFRPAPPPAASALAHPMPPPPAEAAVPRQAKKAARPSPRPEVRAALEKAIVVTGNAAIPGAARAPMAAPPPPPTPVLAGTVTDASGTAVQDATVRVVSESRAIDQQARTDAQGKWLVGAPPPGQYQVTVNAPGFKTEQAAVDLPSAGSQSIQTRLQPGASTDAVQITAGTPVVTPFRQTAETAAQLQPLQPALPQPAMAPRAGMLAPGVGGGGGGGRVGRALSARQLYEEAVAHPEAAPVSVGRINGAAAVFGGQGSPAFGLRYSLLPKAGAAGTFQIELTASADGYVTVTTVAGAVLVSTHVSRGQPFVTPLTPEGEKQVLVKYSLQRPSTVSKVASRNVIGLKAPVSPPIQETIAGVTYVAARTPLGELSFTIKLK